MSLGKLHNLGSVLFDCGNFCAIRLRAQVLSNRSGSLDAGTGWADSLRSTERCWATAGLDLLQLAA